NGQHVIIIGAGIAGLSAATELAERGVKVTILERENHLGGRVSSWPITINGQPTNMSRGFHAFFRQYYQLRALLRRADPHLNALRPVTDYPLDLADGPRDSFTHIPRTPPFNLIGFITQSPSFPLRALPKVNIDKAMGLLDVRFPQTYTDHDGISAADVLNQLNFPHSARHLALEVFARSFFADPHEFSGGELIAMFHTYFIGSAEGLLFDVAADQYDTALWQPLAQYLTRHGATICTNTPAHHIEPIPHSINVYTPTTTLCADAIVLATDITPLQHLITNSPNLGTPTWRKNITQLRTAPPFAVWRRWLDTPPAPGTPDFLGTSGYGPLDNISMIHQFEKTATQWAHTNHGSVIELHAYALPENTNPTHLKNQLTQQQNRLHPELANAKQLGEQWLIRNDCALIDTSPWNQRPSTTTPDPRIVLAGDAIRCDYPVALMERAATTGVLAANHLLKTWDIHGADIWTTPTTPRLPGIPLARRALRRLTKHTPQHPDTQKQ
ncbi:FAD-dependent oxidoreductase, partial [Dermatophilus congolensis]